MARIIAGTILIIAVSGACSVDTESPRETAQSLDVAAPSAPWCVDPPEPSEPPLDIPITNLPPVTGSLIDHGQRVAFSEAREERARVRFTLDELDSHGIASSVTLRVANRTIVVQKAPVKLRENKGSVTLGSGGAVLRDLALEVSYAFQTLKGQRQMSVSALKLVNATDGAAKDDYGPSPWFTDEPNTCEEKALLAFGPLPWDMPYLKFPKIEGCSEARCLRAATEWVHVHLNTWRANQMFAVLENMSDASKSYFWNQPGTDAAGEPVTIESSPAYWYGKWEKARYEAIREATRKHWKVVLDAKVIATNLRLVCPDYDDNPGNVCFNSSTAGHQWVVGYVNMCQRAFEGSGCTDNASTLAEVLHHEPFHHLWVKLHGWKALRDTVTHWDGNTCITGAHTEAVYCEGLVRHFVEESEHCNHLDKLARTIDVHAMFTRRIGDLVFNGEMTHWPVPTDPTPTPPDCEGEVGCLCPDAQGEAPDGDWSINSACADDESVNVCMKTKFNASDTVGICTSCDDLRGPGCECNDLTQPCDQGFCWGDDTNGPSAATGTCYMDPPPDWGCLADCEALLGNNAFCMHDHPDGARCVPLGTQLPEASNCWDTGGHMDPNELSCTHEDECNAQKTCQSLGYPSYFVCDYTNRCVPNP